jgi:enoyl-CoA hydratase/carnithine racemase
MSASRYQRIHVHRDQGVERISLAYPARRNAIGPLMIDELLDALARVEADDTVFAVVLTGEGKVLSAGGDFMQWNASMIPEPRGSERDLGVVAPSPPVQSQVPARGDYATLMNAMLRSTRPIICRVNGHALGSGLGLVMASTFAVALHDAQFGTPEVHAGLFPIMILPLLQRAIPSRRLYEMVLFGDKLDAKEALALQIISRIAEPGELDSTVDEILAKLRRQSRSTIRAGMRAMAEARDLGIEDALDRLRPHFANLLMTDDAREGLLAFVEKRQPVWTGH